MTKQKKPNLTQITEKRNLQYEKKKSHFGKILVKKYIYNKYISFPHPVYLYITLNTTLNPSAAHQARDHQARKGLRGYCTGLRESKVSEGVTCAKPSSVGYRFSGRNIHTNLRESRGN